MEASDALGLLAFFAALLIYKAGSIGFALWIHTVAPDLAERVQDKFHEHKHRAFFLGLINTLTYVFIMMLLFSRPPLGLLGLIMLFFLAAGLLIGFAAAYHDLGLRMRALAPGESVHKIVALGGFTLEAAFLAPVVGQVMATYIGLRGVGALILVLLSRKQSSEASEAAVSGVTQE